MSSQRHLLLTVNPVLESIMKVHVHLDVIYKSSYASLLNYLTLAVKSISMSLLKYLQFFCQARCFCHRY